MELGDDWKTCRDINECLTTDVSCKGICVNTVGSYTCSSSCGASEKLVGNVCVPVCKDGYTRRDGQCVRECGRGFRMEGGSCVRSCGAGEVLRDGACVPVCGPEVCGQGECEVDGSGYRCRCDDGFKFAGGTCVDRDECTEDGSLCPLGECMNTAGSYYCHCMDGYRNDGGHCVDINECEEGVVCSQECVNTPGSYQCRCWEGYTLVPGSTGSCSDIDECSLRPAICEQGCLNLAGGFECTCQQGFRPDPVDSTKCVRAGCQPLAAPTGGKLTCSGGQLRPGSVCSLVCTKGFIRRGKAARTCLEDGEWDEGAGWCEEPSCPSFPPVDNGVMVPETCITENHQIRQKCRVRCRDGFSLEGSPVMICGKRGRWINRQGPPRCVAAATRVPETVNQVPPPQPPATPTAPATPAAPPTHPTPATTETPYISPYIICPPDILVNLTEPLPFQVNSIFRI